VSEPQETPDEYQDRVIAALRAVREASGVDQVPLSIAAGMGHNQIGRIERGERVPSLRQLAAIMQALQRVAVRRTNVTTLHDLLGVVEGEVELTVEVKSPKQG